VQALTQLASITAMLFPPGSIPPGSGSFTITANQIGAIPIIHDWFVNHGIPLYYKAALYGFMTSVALPIGAAIGLMVHPIDPKRTAFVVAFGAGALIFAVSTELYAEALHQVEIDGTGHAQIEIAISMLCAVIGAVSFTYLNIRLEAWSEAQDAKAALMEPEVVEPKAIEVDVTAEAPGDVEVLEEAKSFRRPQTAEKSCSNAALAMWLGVAFDGIPESILIGFITNEMMMTVAFIVSIFVANYPEALASASMLRGKGWPAWKILVMWGSLCVMTTLLSGLSSYVLFWLMTEDSTEHLFHMFGSAVEGLAGGAMLAMVASSMLPEAYHGGGVWAGVFTVIGFLASCTVKVYFGRVAGNENARKAIANEKKLVKASKTVGKEIVQHFFLQAR
jgi:ZIP family zinc transporter